MTGARFLPVGRYLGPFPDRVVVDPAADRIVQVGFALVPLKSVDELHVWRTARRGSAPGAVGIALDELAQAAAVDPRARTESTRLAPSTSLSKSAAREICQRLVERGLLVAVPERADELSVFLRRFRAFSLQRALVEAPARRTEDVLSGVPIDGAIHLDSGAVLHGDAAAVWSWCTVHADLQEAADWLADFDSTATDPARLLRALSELGRHDAVFLDRADAGADRGAGGEVLTGLVDHPMPGAPRDDPRFRWWGLRPRRTAERTCAVGQFLRHSTGPAFDGDAYDVRLGRGLARLSSEAFWSWERALGRHGTLVGGLREMNEHAARMSAVHAEALGWLTRQPLLLNFGGTDDELIAQAQSVRFAPVAEAVDDRSGDTWVPSSEPLALRGLEFEIAVFGHLEPTLWHSIAAVAAQRRLEHRESAQGGSEPIELLRTLLIAPEGLIKRAGYLDLAVSRGSLDQSTPTG